MHVTIELIIIMLKWVAQALIAVVGVWGLLSDPYEKDPQSGRRRLNRAGWVKVGLLTIGFLLFVVTDIDERTKTTKPMRFGPISIRFSSKDPRVKWNQEVQFAWRPAVIRSFDEADGERTYELGEWHSGPNTVKANYAVFEPDQAQAN